MTIAPAVVITALSFRRIARRTTTDARRILVASSLTYIAASFASVIHVWPWLGGVRTALRHQAGVSGASPVPMSEPVIEPLARANTQRRGRGSRSATPGWEQALRAVGKPLIRRWLGRSKHHV